MVVDISFAYLQRGLTYSWLQLFLASPSNHNQQSPPTSLLHIMLSHCCNHHHGIIASHHHHRCIPSFVIRRFPSRCITASPNHVPTDTRRPLVITAPGMESAAGTSTVFDYSCNRTARARTSHPWYINQFICSNCTRTSTSAYYRPGLDVANAIDALRDRRATVSSPA